MCVRCFPTFTLQFEQFFPPLNLLFRTFMRPFIFHPQSCKILCCAWKYKRKIGGRKKNLSVGHLGRGQFCKRQKLPLVSLSRLPSLKYFSDVSCLSSKLATSNYSQTVSSHEKQKLGKLYFNRRINFIISNINYLIKSIKLSHEQNNNSKVRIESISLLLLLLYD